MIGKHAYYQCQHPDCGRRWRLGGVTVLDRHWAELHGRPGGAQYARVDAAGNLLDGQGHHVTHGGLPVPPPAGVDGLIRSQALLGAS